MVVGLSDSGMSMGSQSSTRQGFFANKAPGVGGAALALLFCLMTSACLAGPAFALKVRSSYFGDPYLMTNNDGQIFLVVNPELLDTNSAYQTKVAALAGQENPDPKNPWAYVINAAKKATQARQIFTTAPATFDDFAPKRANSANEASEPPPAPPVALAAIQAPQPSAPIFNNDFRQRAVQFSYVLQHWLLFSFVALFILRRIWRYFREVEDDDDFANHLATLAVAHRWVFPVYMTLLISVAVAEFLQLGNLFFSLSVLMLASSIRGYYCEGDFADYPKLQKLHLGLSLGLVALGWAQGFDNYLADTTTWIHGHALRDRILFWLMLAFFIRAFRGLIHSPDFTRQRGNLISILFSFGAIGLAGGGVGALLWLRLGWGTTVLHGTISGAVFASFLLSVVFFVGKNPVFMQLFGGTVIDMFVPRLFSEPALKQRHVPSLLLLQHWREQGDIQKAWDAARAHLYPEIRALPIWLFALETAVLYRRQPDDALSILDRLCATEELSYDHRTAAVAQVAGWMAAAGFTFNAARFQIKRAPLAPTALADRVQQKCEQGRANEAAAELRAVLDEDYLNETAFVQLVRIYCQDLKNRRGAENLIAEAQDTFSPKLLDFLSRTLDEWIQMPIRSTAKKKGFREWLWPAQPKEPRPYKLSLTTPPISQKPRPTAPGDSLETYMERVRQAHGKPADTSGIIDPAQKLLAERRLGMAVAIIKEQAEAAPDDFDLWLRYAEAIGHHCADPTAAEKIIRQMERSGHFKKAQIKKAHTRLRKWLKLHAARQDSW